MLISKKTTQINELGILGLMQWAFLGAPKMLSECIKRAVGHTHSLCLGCPGKNASLETNSIEQNWVSTLQSQESCGFEIFQKIPLPTPTPCWEICHQVANSSSCFTSLQGQTFWSATASAMPSPISTFELPWHIHLASVSSYTHAFKGPSLTSC